MQPVAASGGVVVCWDWPALTPALAEIRLFYFRRCIRCARGSESAARSGLDLRLGLSWLFNPRRQAHFLLEVHIAVVLMPNV